MAWWQIILIVVGAIVLGLAVGYVLSILISRAIPAPSQRELKVKKAPVQDIKPPVVSLPPVTKPLYNSTSDSVSDLMAEIEYNRQISNGEWKGELQLFQTNVWDAKNDEVQKLPADLRNELNEAYSDMALANSITWLSTEMKRRSPSLDESYTRLRSSVCERINRTKPQLDNNRFISRSTSPPRQ